ncbi:MAG: restriction endonuclease [bacterium]
MTRVWVLVLLLGGGCAWTDVAGMRWYGVAMSVLALLVAAHGVRSGIRRRRARRTVRGLRALHPGEFETEVGRWLRREGWQVEHRGGTGDGGIDILARRGKEMLAVQCKRYAETAAVSAAQVRDLYGAAIAEGSTQAALVTTGRISRAATAWCESLPAGPRFRLFDAAAVGELAAGRARFRA